MLNHAAASRNSGSAALPAAIERRMFLLCMWSANEGSERTAIDGAWILDWGQRGVQSASLENPAEEDVERVATSLGLGQLLVDSECEHD